MNKVEFSVRLFDDESTRKKVEAISRLEAALDDERNPLPDEFYDIIDEVPFGSTIKMTIEHFTESENQTKDQQWVEWIEPFGPNNEPVYCRVTRETAIATQRRIHEYASDQDALDDFVTVHWAEAK
jgi:hypothetical protein